MLFPAFEYLVLTDVSHGSFVDFDHSRVLQRCFQLFRGSLKESSEEGIDTQLDI